MSLLNRTVVIARIRERAASPTARWRLDAISAGLVPVGGWAVNDEAAGAEVGGEIVAITAAVVVVVVAIRGNEGKAVASGEVRGVRRIARRRESSSRS